MRDFVKEHNDLLKIIEGSDCYKKYKHQIEDIDKQKNNDDEESVKFTLSVKGSE
jgi:hypothetical protein